MGYAYVDNARMGRDGSLLITRRSSDDMGYVNDFIRSHGSEAKVGIGAYETFVTDYRDAKSYVGFYYEQVGAAQYPESPETAFTMTQGRLNVLGLGSPVKTWSPNEMLVEISVDSENRPSGQEMRDDGFLRLYRGGRSYEIGRLDFVGSLPDHTVLLWREPNAYLWRQGRYLSALRLPEHWEPVRIDSRGEILVRHRVSDGPDDETVERRWEMGILRGNVIARLAFARPPGTRKLLWRDTYGFSDDGSVRFEAFYGGDLRAYRVQPLG